VKRKEGGRGGREGGKERDLLVLGAGDQAVHLVLEGVVEIGGGWVGGCANSTGISVEGKGVSEGGREGGREKFLK